MAKSIISSEVKTIILACEAGMGSSLMSVNALKKKLKKAKVDQVQVVHKAARDIPPDAKLVVVHSQLAKVAHGKAPEAVIVTFNNFFNDPAFDKLVDAFKADTEIPSAL